MIKREKFLPEYFGQVSLDDMFIYWEAEKERSNLNYDFGKFVSMVRCGSLILVKCGDYFLAIINVLTSKKGKK